jgi:hypothetical protein
MYPHQARNVIEGLPRASFQARVYAWLLTCFGEEITFNKNERNHRFLEESLELVQSLDCTREEAHMLVDYVFDRPVGEPHQEAGGALVTLAALCVANDFKFEDLGEVELARAWGKIDQIREKPRNSPLPGKYPSEKSFPQPDRNRKGKEPCGECHLELGETCDICGARFSDTNIFDESDGIPGDAI